MARQNSRTGVKVGDQVGMQIDTATAHLFDAQGRIAHTGQSGQVGGHMSGQNLGS